MQNKKKNFFTSIINKMMKEQENIKVNIDVKK